jgi:hypothetical protein
MASSKMKETKTKDHICSKLKNTHKQRHYRFCKMSQLSKKTTYVTNKTAQTSRGITDFVKCVSAFKQNINKWYIKLRNSDQLKHIHLYFSVSRA